MHIYIYMSVCLSILLHGRLQQLNTERIVTLVEHAYIYICLSVCVSILLHGRLQQLNTQRMLTLVEHAYICLSVCLSSIYPAPWPSPAAKHTENSNPCRACIYIYMSVCLSILLHGRLQQLNTENINPFRACIYLSVCLSIYLSCSMAVSSS